MPSHYRDEPSGPMLIWRLRNVLASWAVVGFIAIGCHPQVGERIPPLGGPLAPLGDSLVQRGLSFRCGKGPPVELANGRAIHDATLCTARSADTTYALAVDARGRVIQRHREWQVREEQADSTLRGISATLTRTVGPPRACEAAGSVPRQVWAAATYLIVIRAQPADRPGLPTTVSINEQREGPSCSQ